MRDPDKTAAGVRSGPPPAFYYVRWQGETTGPFDWATIESKWQAGSISRLHQISSDRKQWQALGAHPDLKRLLSPAATPAPPPPPPPPGAPAGDPDAACEEAAAASARAPLQPLSARLSVPPMPPGVPPPVQATSGPPRPPVAPADLAASALGPAAWGRRLTAALLDLAVLTLVGICGGLLLQAVGLPLGGQTPAQRLICGLLLAYSGWLYSAVLESCAWQATLGKLAVGLRVQTEAGEPLDFGTAALRAFMKFGSVLPALAGVLSALCSPSRQAWHDRVARTSVVGGSAVPIGGDWPQ